MSDKIVYDVIQRFELIDGVPQLISTDIKTIQGGTTLFSIAETWLAKNTQLVRCYTEQYVGYKNKRDKRYQLVLTPRATSLQVAFPASNLSGKVKFVTENDALFPYALKVSIENKETLIKLLNDLFPQHQQQQ
ncbi:hypothetical protein [Microcoleus sp. Pol17_C1]|uniref:hypothetical protein n=1 Tax=unclassified Microcoleus TaxID=2642155 RepID=UPI002FD1D136